MFTEKNHLGDLLLHEVHPRWTRQKSTLAALSADAPLGSVLGKVTASGKYVPLAPAANDGSQNAAAVLAEDLAESVADQEGITIRRGAVLNAAALVWPAGATTNQKAAALAQLEALGIVAETVL